MATAQSVGSGHTTPKNVQSLFPAPPPYFELYTDHNISLLKAHSNRKQDAKALEGDDEITINVNGVPTSCDVLLPPAPLKGTYSMFGHTLTTEKFIPSLEDAGLTQLYRSGPDVDYRIELKRLVVCSGVQYSRLIQTLATNPLEQGDAVLRLQTILLNLLHLVGTYRPHQAMETLALLMEKGAFDVSTSCGLVAKSLEHTLGLINDLCSAESVSSPFLNEESISGIEAAKPTDSSEAFADRSQIQQDSSTAGPNTFQRYKSKISPSQEIIQTLEALKSI
jgi:mediator of RNA polymerase II transcription subunit 7